LTPCYDDYTYESTYTVVQSWKKNTPSITCQISYTTSLGPTSSPDCYFAHYIYKAKAAKAKTTDKAMAMELTIETEVAPGELPVAVAGAAPLEVALTPAFEPDPD
jgi:hypothetical protein